MDHVLAQVPTFFLKLMSMSTHDPLLDLGAYVAAFESWLVQGPASLGSARQATPVFADRVESMSNLMADLFAAGWSRYGWPVEVGGLGGTIRHRAAMWDGLARHGVPGMCVFEHLEVLGPTLVELAPRRFVALTFPQFLAGTQLWSQGFSEPDAGSDLASLRTRATPVEGGYLISGRKIWTSWSRYATWCLVLARTGTPESRHRGITAFIVELADPGVEVRVIEQANGTDELAEVTFDDVFAPTNRIVGELDGGWAVAMHILSSERGTYAWFRHGFLYHGLLTHLPYGDETTDRSLGNALLDLAAVSATGYRGLESHEAGIPLGPRSAFTKLLLGVAEQSAQDWILSVDGDLAVGDQDAATAVARQEYLFSRAVTIYGGTRQMQLETIAKQILRLP